MAGGWSTRLCRPAAASIVSTPSMMFVVHAFACSRWYSSMTARSFRTFICVTNSSPATRSGCFPAATAGAITSEFHQADSVSTRRRRQSPAARNSCWMAIGLKPRGDLERDELGVRQLALANAIVGLRRAGSGRFADVHQQVDRDAGPLGELREGDVAEHREPLIGGHVEEVERDLAALQDGAQAVQRDARRRQACRRAPHGARAPVVKRPSASGLRMPSSTMPAQLLDAESGPLGRFGDLVRLHEPYCSGGASRDVARDVCHRPSLSSTSWRRIEVLRNPHLHLG